MSETTGGPASTGAAGSVETRADVAKEGLPGLARHWLDAIALAGEEERDWRRNAGEAVALYRSEKPATSTAGPKAQSSTRFNILYSNTETLAPAVYNATPAPDVRVRYGEGDASLQPAAPPGPAQGMQGPPPPPGPPGQAAAPPNAPPGGPGGPPGGMMPPPMQVVQDPSRTAGRVIERALVYTLDCEPIDPAMEGSVKDLLLCGRGVTRIHHDPGVDESGQPTGMPSVAFELVPWEDFRHGPALRWADVEWMAVRKRLTREQIVKLNPEIGEDMSLDAWVPGSEKRQPSGGEGAAPPDVMKRGTVWEIWDKASKRVYFVAPASPEAPLAVVPDPLGLKAFFPYPEPIYAIRSSGSLVPVEPYRLYKGLATELEDLSNRIAKLVRALKWRGAYLDVSQGDFLARFEKLADGEMTPIENPAAMSSASGGALDKAFWFMPIDVLVKVLEQLYLAREQVKQSIYEVTGISDILRGASKAEETATAQNIKQQWGSLRVQKMQTEVARMARDLIRLAAEIVCEKYPPELLAAMTGMQEEMTPEVAQLLRSDAARTFRIDIETDSTIKADLQRVQQNVSGFVQGLGGFITAVAPAVQGGLMPMPLVAEMIATFARAFRLPGRKLEEMLDALPAMAAQMPPPVQPNPQADAKAQADHDMAKTHAEIGSKERIAKMGIDAEGARHRQTLQMEQQKRMSEQPDIMAAVASERAVAAVAQQMLAAATAASQASEQQAQMVEQAVSTIEQATAHIMMPRRVQRDGAGRPTALSPVPM